MSKYHAKRTTVDNVTFASKREAARYADLKLLERAKRISDLKLQPKFRLTVNGQHIANYIADFSYFDHDKARHVVEDSKGFKTPAYRLKRKLMLAVHGIEIVES